MRAHAAAESGRNVHVLVRFHHRLYPGNLYGTSELITFVCIDPVLISLSRPAIINSLGLKG